MKTTASLPALADQCVKCGLCLPQCPTYTLSRNENESPRGRISLVQAIATGQLEASAALTAHLDHCLQCRRCERVCPSQVSYGEIIQRARYELPALQVTPSRLARLGLWFIARTSRQNALRRLILFYQRSGLQWLARHSGLLKRLQLADAESRLPLIHPARPRPANRQNTDKPRIAIFTGCSQPLFDNEVIRASQLLLEQLGYQVEIPATQFCCGALHMTQGKAAQAQHLLAANQQVFNASKYDTVLYLATGCGVFLTEQGDNRFAHFREITEFLSNEVDISSLSFRARNTKVAVHLPCSQKNVLRHGNLAYQLLQQIPGLQLLNMEQSGCCGAGGTIMLSDPQLAEQVREPLVQQVLDEACELVVTTNPGCQLHLQQGTGLQLLHPVTLLAQQLEA